MSKVYSTSFHGEGQDIGEFNCDPLGPEILDMTRFPRKAEKPIKLGEIDLKRMRNLIQRQVIMGFLEAQSTSNKVGNTNKVDTQKVARYASMAFIARRKGQERGRIVINFKPLNHACKSYVVPFSHAVGTHESLLRAGNKIYSEGDIASAFQTLRYSEHLQPLTAIQTPDELYFCIRGLLGLKSMPAIFTQLAYPHYTRLRTSPKLANIFYEELKLAYHKDKNRRSGSPSKLPETM